MHLAALVKQDSSRLLQSIHKRALWAAMRAAGGDTQHAATALGLTVAELLALLEGDPASMSSPGGPPRAISGTRPRTVPPNEVTPIEDDPGRASDDDPDGSAW